ncbi:MAG: beta-galactosidase [Bacteroidia bacterium]|nr:beta-galactosidase [Bacteroidia bacterium]
MKRLKILILFVAFIAFTVSSSSQIPQLKNNGKTTQLIVHGKPFLMLAGEANNSSGSNIAHMEKTTKDLRESNLNSLLVSVSWEIVEPQEGIFDFSSVDELIRVARENDMKLCLLWFASWKNGSKTKGTWSEVFGQGDDADLFFMAWQYSRYVNTIAEAGKKAYNLPMFVNCWMPQPRPKPGKPGNYPSGGPIVSVLDVWKAGAPSVDILAPDIYGADFKDQVNNFHRADNPLFIPETSTTEGPASWAFAEHDAICFSPFGIDNRGSVMAREYALLNQLMPVIYGVIIPLMASGHTVRTHQNLQYFILKCWFMTDSFISI